MTTAPATYETLPIGQIRPLGWMLAQMQRDLHGFAGHLDELTKEASFDTFGVNRKDGSEHNAPPNPDATAWRWWWRGETEAVWLDGLVRMAFLAGDADYSNKARRILTHILEHQEPDGYIGVYKPSDRYRHTSGNGELWTQSRIFIALLAYAEITGDPKVLPAVRRAVDLTMSHYNPDHPYFRSPVTDGGVAHGLMFIDVLEWLYRITADARYLQFAEFLFNDFAGAENMPRADNRPINLLDPAKPYHGHTPHTTEQLRVLLFLAHSAGKDLYRRCVDAAFQKVSKHITVSAACIGDENIHGRPPTGEMFYEYCAITELMNALHSRLQKTGELACAEKIERLVFNAAQGARLADGMGITYLTQDNRLEATRALARPGFKTKPAKFSPTHEDVAVCCNPNAVKLLPYHVGQMWLRMNAPEPGLAVVAYGPCRLTTTIAGKSVIISQRTDYPFEDRITFDIEHADNLDLTIEFRIPAWSTRTTLTIGSERRQVTDPSTRIRRTWKTGESVILDFAPAITLEESCDHQAVVVRGPLVYAVPLPDQRISVKDYSLPAFHDYDILPAQQDAWNLSMPRGPASFQLQNHPENLKDPWTLSPLELRGTMITPTGTPSPTTLIPMGCTTLRRVTFPWAD